MSKHGENKEGERSFRHLSMQERLDWLEENTKLSKDGRAALERSLTAGKGSAIEGENHFTYMIMSCGILPRITVNGVHIAVPMLVEEASVIAGASYAAKAAEKRGGFKSKAGKQAATGQVQIVGVPAGKAPDAVRRVNESREELARLANAQDPFAKLLTLEAKLVQTRRGNQIIVYYDADCGDAMGAAMVSKMGEAMKPVLNKVTGGEPLAAIVSNLALGRVVTSEAVFDKESLAWREEIDGKATEISGEKIISGILDMAAWAEADQLRATTHNKGIMNGIDAVGAALQQDTRALEAGAHSYAAYSAKNGRYAPLTSFSVNSNGDLVGRIELPIAVGTVGGAIKTNAVVRAFMEIMNCKSARELSEIMAAVGLAQNLAALRMLVSFGLTKGHGGYNAAMKKKADSLKADGGVERG